MWSSRTDVFLMIYSVAQSKTEALPWLRASRNPAAQQVQGHLHGEGADTLAIAQELPAQRGSARGIGHPHVHGALRNLFTAGFRSRGSRDGERVGGVGAAARAQGHGFGGFLADGAVLRQRLRAHAE